MHHLLCSSVALGCMSTLPPPHQIILHLGLAVLIKQYPRLNHLGSPSGSMMVCVGIVNCALLVILLYVGLRHCKWAGRNQVVERGNVVYYLDGAHTPGSVVASAHWFHSEMQEKEG